MMRLYFILLSVVALAEVAAQDKIARGAIVYRNSCGVAYCHGAEGKPGRAPGFVGRALTPDFIARTVVLGISGTSMPPFAGTLKREDIEAVTAYLVSLGAAGASEVATAKPAKLAPEIERGRVLFFDPGRLGSCGYCHEVGVRGAPVSLALQDLRSANLDLQAVQTPMVVTARPEGEDPFPAVVVEKTATRVRVYDLSPLLPVLRTFTPVRVTLTPGSTWRHASVTSRYTSAELDAITGYLRVLSAH